MENTGLTSPRTKALKRERKVNYEKLAGYPLRLEGKSSVCLICMKYRIIFFNYYHYNQPGSNIIIIYCKHARADASLFDGSVPANRDGPLHWWQQLVAGH